LSGIGNHFVEIGQKRSPHFDLLANDGAKHAFDARGNRVQAGRLGLDRLAAGEVE
jgi:Tfp pilus tip-associated adhesin PilY1